jgi:hypothetical protein
MSSYDAIKQLCSTLNRHHEAIADAYLNNQRQIPLNEETEKAIKALTKQKLVWNINEYDGAQLSRKLVSLLDLAVRSNRRLSSDSIGSLWRELDDHLADYNISRNPTDRENSKTSLQECAYNLIEEIQRAITQYATYIDRNYAFANSIELRLQQNERVLKRAKDLAEIMEGCDLSQYQSGLSAAPELRQVFCRYLPQAFERARKEFRRTISDLQNLITKIREEQGLSNLIRCFQAQYEKAPGFFPETPGIQGRPPESFNIATKLLKQAKPNIYIESQVDDLAALVQNLKFKQSGENNAKQNKIISVSDVRDQIAEPLPSDELLEAAQASIEWLFDSGATLTAFELHQRLNIKDSFDIWLYALANTVYSLDETSRESINMEFIDQLDPIFSGNRTILDLQLSVKT